jgi:hypothetical protein
VEFYLLLQSYVLERVLLLPRLSTIHAAASLERNLPQRNIMLLPNRSNADPVKDWALLCMLLWRQHHIHIRQPSKTRAAFPTTRETILRDWEKMAVVLHAHGGCICNHKCSHGRGCRPILSARAANCAEQLLLDPDVADDHVYSLGKCQTLGKLAGKTIGRPGPFYAETGRPPEQGRVLDTFSVLLLCLDGMPLLFPLHQF